MTKPLLIAASVALALSVTACNREEKRAERENMAPGANIATTVPPSSPVDTGGAHSSGATSGTGAGGMISGPDPAGGPGAAASPPGTSTAPAGEDPSGAGPGAATVGAGSTAH